MNQTCTVTALLAAIGIAAPIAAAQVTLFDSNGFEASDYALGAIANQNGWRSWESDRPAISAANAQAGTQSLEFAQGDSNLAVQRTIGYDADHPDYRPRLDQVVITFDIMMTQPAQDLNAGGIFLSVSNLDGIAGDPLNNIGVALSAADPAAVGSNKVLEYGTWHRFELSIDTTREQASAMVDGNVLASVDVASSFFNNENIGDIQLRSVNDGGFGGSFFVDNLTVAAVPAPGPVAMLGVAAMASRRRRR